MSGELKASVEWAPVDPVAQKPKRRRKRRTPPTTRRGAILFGLRRLGLVLSWLGGAVALAAALVVWLGGGPTGRVFPLAFYLAGALLGVVAVLGGTGTSSPVYWERPSREQAFNSSFVYAGLALLLIAVGFLLDYLL
jgi:hypothetical protein